MRQLWRIMPGWIKNPYLLFGISFLVWMVCFDAEDLVTQYRLEKKLKNLAAEKDFYLKGLTILRQERGNLANDPALLEKFAREKFFMKKKTEDLYIVVEDCKLGP